MNCLLPKVTGSRAAKKFVPACG